MDEREVSSLVPKRIVEQLEVVDVEYRQAQALLPAVSARRFDFVSSGQAATIRQLRELVLVESVADRHKLFLQRDDAALVFVHLPARRQKLVAGALDVRL